VRHIRARRPHSKAKPTQSSEIAYYAVCEAFAGFKYPNEIGPGVYDIHSPRIPTVQEMEALLEKAAALLPARNLWVNPDCGLKTRKWPETKQALINMVQAARQLRKVLA